MHSDKIAQLTSIAESVNERCPVDCSNDNRQRRTAAGCWPRGRRCRRQQLKYHQQLQQQQQQLTVVIVASMQTYAVAVIRGIQSCSQLIPLPGIEIRHHTEATEPQEIDTFEQALGDCQPRAV